MTKTSYPFDNSAAYETQWTKMARLWRATGVIYGLLNALAVYADSTGMQVKVPTGGAWILGHYFHSTAEEILAIAAADATNPRIDRVILQLDWTANEISLEVLTGTPASSPSAPALTQTDGTLWEISLAQIAVAAAASTIAAGNVTDERTISIGDPLVATAAEINTGTDTAKFVSPDALAGAYVGTKNVQLVVIPQTTVLTTGDNKITFVVPPELNGMNLVDADAALTGVVATGATLPLIQVRNATDSADMLSTRITIDASEWTSFTAVAPPVIDATKDDVVTGDRLAIDIDAIGNSTPGTGLNVLLSFRLP